MSMKRRNTSICVSCLYWPYVHCCAVAPGWALTQLPGSLSSAPAAGALWHWCRARGANKHEWSGCWGPPLCWIWPVWPLHSLCTGSTPPPGLRQTQPGERAGQVFVYDETNIFCRAELHELSDEHWAIHFIFQNSTHFILSYVARPPFNQVIQYLTYSTLAHCMTFEQA